MRQVREPVGIEGGSFAIVSSGFADGPAQPLRDHLRRSGASLVVMVSHPLVAEQTSPHTVVRYESGEEADRRHFTLPNRPPLTYAFDPFIPLRYPRVDAWFGFNCVATGVGLGHRALGRTRRVVHWSVDYVPDRFGRGPLTWTYETLDARCCRASDARVELSDAARTARNDAYGLVGDAADAVLVPMGAWMDETPKAAPENAHARRIVFLGHLVPRMGVDTLLDALELLVHRGVEFEADIVGGGPLEAGVRNRAASPTFDGRITCHGFVRAHRDVERILARATVGVAPYDESPGSFSRFADPGKLKAYLGAGLPILLTDVPPNAHEIVERGGGGIVAGSAPAFADAIQRIIDDPPGWQVRHTAALALASEFDWTHLFERALPALGIEP